MEAFLLPYQAIFLAPAVSWCLSLLPSQGHGMNVPSLLYFPNTAVCGTVFPNLPFHTTPADQLMGSFPFKVLIEMPTFAMRTQC